MPHAVAVASGRVSEDAQLGLVEVFASVPTIVDHDTDVVRLLKRSGLTPGDKLVYELGKIHHRDVESGIAAQQVLVGNSAEVSPAEAAVMLASDYYAGCWHRLLHLPYSELGKTELGEIDLVVAPVVAAYRYVTPMVAAARRVNGKGWFLEFRMFKEPLDGNSAVLVFKAIPDLGALIAKTGVPSLPKCR